MTATEQWITDAGLEGAVLINAWGWIENALLKPEHWQAVGKTRGWEDAMPEPINTTWLDFWHQFITHLADGLTIEEALLALENK